MAVRAIIHCLPQIEPKGFHVSDQLHNWHIKTYSVSLAVEIRSDGGAPLEADEEDGEKLFRTICQRLHHVAFYWHRFDPSGTVTSTPNPVEDQISDRAFDGDALCNWLRRRQPPTGRFWTTVRNADDNQSAVEASRADAFTLSRAVASWDAPMGHRIHFMHLVRLTNLDGWMVLLPYFADHGNQQPASSLADAPAELVNIKYYADPDLEEITCQTPWFQPYRDVSPLPTGTKASGAIADPDIDANGFLRLNKEAEALSRFLDRFEARSSSLLAANAGLQFSNESELAALEARIGFSKDASGNVTNWGTAGWYVMARLTSALDPLIIALLQPRADDDAGGPVLAPLALVMLDALDRQRTDANNLFDYEPRLILKAVREVLIENCALAGAKSTTLLSRSVKHIFEIEPALLNQDKTVVADQPPATLVALLVDSFVETSDGSADPLAADFLSRLSQDPAEILTVALSEIEQKLQDEAGAERALLRIFDTVEFADKSATPKESFAKQLALKIEQLTPITATHTVIGTVAPAELLAGVEDGWARYRAMIEGPFNGAEAVRRAAAGAAARILLTAANIQSKPDYPTVKTIRTLVEEADYHSRRFTSSPSGKVFDYVAAALVIPSYRGLVPDFSAELSHSYKVALDLEPLNPERFIPDSAPQHLPIQIASGIDGDGLDAFAHSFNGLAVAIRRKDNSLDIAADRWAYANLADLTWTSSIHHRVVDAALDSVMPATTDGRGTMFLNYDGVPFSDRPDRNALDGDAYDKAPPFYSVTPHAFAGGGDFARLPRLAYGRKFESFSFVTTNAGTIPLALQQSDQAPWMPQEKIEVLFDGSTNHLGLPWEPPKVLEYVCSRRTAVSQMSIVENGDARQPGRIGRELAGVIPLSKDYPRLGSVARPDGAGTIDLFRDTDGLGRLVFPETVGAELSWKWTDLRTSGPTGGMSIRVFDGPAQGPDHLGVFQVPVADAGSSADFELRLSDIQAGDVTAEMREGRWLTLWVNGALVKRCFIEKLSDIKERHCWVRIVVLAKTNTLVSFSLVDPDGQRPGGQGVPLLLLAPSFSSLWHNGLAEPVTTVIRTPRVGYADFTRWMANSNLAIEAYGKEGQQSGNGRAFAMYLAIANRMRHLDKNLGQYLDTLPDPAVERIALELQITDQLHGPVQAPGSEHFDVPRLETWLAQAAFPDPNNLTPEILINSIFRPLDQHFQFTVTMAPAPASRQILELINRSNDSFDVAVPVACVTRFAMHALVPLKHFLPQFGTKHPPVIDAKLQQYATRHIDRFVGFEGGVRLIECMFDGIDALTANDNELAASLAASQIFALQIKDTRRYDLVTKTSIDDSVRDVWRLLAEVDVTTQRWRATGRPIYHYIAPRNFALGDSGKQGHPSMPLGASDTPALNELDRFEREAFFDRADVDAHTITQRLLPLNASTLVQDFPWDAASATYFRHRFTLRSRYAGALAAKQSSPAWRTETKNQPSRSSVWTMRVAMLAERSRLTLTRPQLRGLIPLTSTPAASGTRLPAPPVAAILQEPPFSRGGLADRITSEIRTGFGFGFDKDVDGNPVDPVKVQDSRKEIGPNPHFDYRPFPAGRVHSMALQSEGPLGLTFDTTDSSTPALANSMVLLRPIALDGEAEPPLQESLTAVSMRRYADPAWLAGVPFIYETGDPVAIVPDLGRCWWLEFDQQGGRISYILADEEPTDIVEISRDNDFLIVSVWKGPIDSGVGKEDRPVEVGRFRATRGGRPAILHQETTSGNYLISVLIDSGSSRTEDGEQNVPVTLCSFEWSLPRERVIRSADIKPSSHPRLIVTNHGSALTIWETMASAATALRWTQISRDFDFVSVIDQRDTRGDRPKSESVRFDRLRAKIVGHRSIAFKTMGNNREATVCRTTTGNPYPAHVHRHVAMISTSFVGELGRSVEKFSRAALSVEYKPRFAADAQGPEHAVRVIEFETPASIVCGKDVPAPAAYRSAYFDFIRTGYVKENALLLTMRFVGSREHLKSFKSVSFDLSQRDSSAPTTVTHVIDTSTTAPITLHAHIEGKSIKSWIVYEDKTGDVVTTPTTLLLDPNRVAGFWMTLATEPSAATEFWTDVSLLHGPIVTGMEGGNIDPRAIRFDFNWLFSPHIDGNPATLVSPKGLSEMVEAQARIVTVSPPIPLSAN